MPESSSVFPLWHIALTAAIASAARLLLLWLRNKRSPAMTTREAIAAALVAGLSIIAWRLAGNVAQRRNTR